MSIIADYCLGSLSTPGLSPDWALSPPLRALPRRGNCRLLSIIVDYCQLLPGLSLHPSGPSPEGGIADYSRLLSIIADYCRLLPRPSLHPWALPRRKELLIIIEYSRLLSIIAWALSPPLGPPQMEELSIIVDYCGLLSIPPLGSPLGLPSSSCHPKPSRKKNYAFRVGSAPIRTPGAALEQLPPEPQPEEELRISLRKRPNTHAWGRP